MKKISKVLALLLAFVLLCGIVAGCGNNNTSSENSGSGNESSSELSSAVEDTSSQVSGDESSETSKPEITNEYLSNYDGDSVQWDRLVNQWKYDELITVTTARDISTGYTDYSTNVYYAASESILNIKVENVLESDSYTNELEGLISSGNLPDFFRLNFKQFDVAYEQGLIMNLDDYYAAYATDELKYESYGVESFKEAVTQGGSVYGVPATFEDNVIPLDFIFVRGDWRKQAGLSVEDMADFESVVKLAKYAKSAYGMGFMGNPTALNVDWGVYWMYNAHGAYKEIWVEDENGDLVYSSIQPEMRNALETMAGLYKQGLLKLTTDEGATTWAEFNGGTLGIIGAKQWMPYSYPEGVGGPNSSVMEGYGIPAADGVDTAKAQMNIVPSAVYAVNANCQYPEVVFLLADLYVEKAWSNDSFREARKGAPVVTSVQAFEHFWVGLNLNKYYKGEMSFQELSNLTENVNCLGGSPHVFGEGGTVVDYYTSYIVNGQVQGDMWNHVNTPTYAQKWSALIARENTVIRNIITGSADITAFDDFVTWWNENGGSEIANEINAARK